MKELQYRSGCTVRVFSRQLQVKNSGCIHDVHVILLYFVDAMNRQFIYLPEISTALCSRFDSRRLDARPQKYCSTERSSLALSTPNRGSASNDNDRTKRRKRGEKVNSGNNDNEKRPQPKCKDLTRTQMLTQVAKISSEVGAGSSVGNGLIKAFWGLISSARASEIMKVSFGPCVSEVSGGITKVWSEFRRVTLWS